MNTRALILYLMLVSGANAQPVQKEPYTMAVYTVTRASTAEAYTEALRFCEKMPSKTHRVAEPMITRQDEQAGRVTVSFICDLGFR